MRAPRPEDRANFPLQGGPVAQTREAGLSVGAGVRSRGWVPGVSGSGGRRRLYMKHSPLCPDEKNGNIIRIYIYSSSLPRRSTFSPIISACTGDHGPGPALGAGGRFLQASGVGLRERNGGRSHCLPHPQEEPGAHTCPLPSMKPDIRADPWLPDSPRGPCGPSKEIHCDSLQFLKCSGLWAGTQCLGVRGGGQPG